MKLHLIECHRTPLRSWHCLRWWLGVVRQWVNWASFHQSHIINTLKPGDHFIKYQVHLSMYKLKDSYHKDKTVMRPHLYIGNVYSAKPTRGWVWNVLNKLVNIYAVEALVPCFARISVGVYWSWKLRRSLSFMRKDFNYMHNFSV